MHTCVNMYASCIHVQSVTHARTHTHTHTHLIMCTLHLHTRATAPAATNADALSPIPVATGSIATPKHQEARPRRRSDHPDSAVTQALSRRRGNSRSRGKQAVAAPPRTPTPVRKHAAAEDARAGAASLACSTAAATTAATNAGRPEHLRVPEDARAGAAGAASGGGGCGGGGVGVIEWLLSPRAVEAVLGIL